MTYRIVYRIFYFYFSQHLFQHYDIYTFFYLFLCFKIKIMWIGILFLESFHIHISIYYVRLILFRFIFFISLSFHVKRFELRKETALYQN